MNGKERLNDRIDTVLKGVDRVLCWVLALGMATMLIASVVQVTSRYVLETTVIGPEEIARYMMTGGTFLAVPVLARRRNHIAVDAITHFLPVGVGRIWLTRGILVIELLFLAAFAFFALEVLQSVHESGQFSAGLRIPASYPFSTVFIGSALAALITIAMLVQSWLNPDPMGGVDTYEDVETMEGPAMPR